jgi:hypothetical protein
MQMETVVATGSTVASAVGALFVLFTGANIWAAIAIVIAILLVTAQFALAIDPVDKAGDTDGG